MNINTIALRAVFLLGGIFIIYTSYLSIFGTPESMGLTETSGNLEVFKQKYSHVRFFGGIWLCIGLLFLAATIAYEKLLPLLKFTILLIFVGGIARFVDFDTNILLNNEIIGSLIAELIGMPLLFLWLRWTTRQA